MQTNNKVILNLNPSNLSIMKTTIYIVTEIENNFSDFDNYINSIKNYIPNYNVTKPL